MNEESEIRNPKSKIAYIFPGQGSQSIGMGKDLFANFSVAREVFKEADDALGFSLSEMCFAGTAEDLALTANTQPAILTTSRFAQLRAKVLLNPILSPDTVWVSIQLWLRLAR
jgi:[acyl-carrier-protein] S-malonyltransferase